MADNQWPQEELEDQESLRDYLDPIVGLGERGWADIVEMYEGTKSLLPLGKMLWELTARGKTQEEREAQEARRVEMIKALYKEAPIEMAKDVAKLVQPEEWYEHPVHTAMRAMIAKELITGLPRVGPKISATVGKAARRGAGAAVRGMEKAKLVQPIGEARIAWAQLGGYSPDEIVTHFRDITSKDILRRTGKRVTTATEEAAKESRLSAEMVARGTELTVDQINDLRKLSKALKAMPEKKHPGLLQHWSKKFKMSIADLKKIMKATLEEEAGVVIKGKEFRAPWEMTKTEFLSEAKGLSPEMYDDIIFNAYKRGMDIPDEVLAPFKGQFTPRNPRPGITPKGAEPLWARGTERVGQIKGKYATLKRQHPTELPKGYLDIEEVMGDGWVRYVGPGTFEVQELNPTTLQTMASLIKEHTPRHGVVVDITTGGGFELPIWEIETKGFINSVRKSFPKLLAKTKKEVVGGRAVDVEVIPEGVSAKTVTKGPRKTPTTQEVIDLITGEEGAVGPKRTILRKGLKGEEGSITIGGPSRSEIEARLGQVTRQLGVALEEDNVALANRLRDTQAKLRTRLEALGEPKYTSEQLGAMRVEKLQRNKAAYKELIAERELFLQQLKKALPDAEETAKTTKSLQDLRYADSIKAKIGRVEDDLAKIKHRGLGDITPIKE